MDLLGIGMKNQYLRSSKSYRDVYFCYLAVARNVFVTWSLGAHILQEPLHNTVWDAENVSTN